MKDAKGQFMSRGHPTSILTGREYSALRLVCYTCSYIFLAPKGKAHSHSDSCAWRKEKGIRITQKLAPSIK